MRSLLTPLLLLLGAATAAASTAVFARVDGNAMSTLFGVRGGGIFGKGDKKEKETEQKLYPAMTQEEIEEWLGHIPVFAVTDKNGSGVVLRPDNETSVFYFFMSPMMANATLTQLQEANTDLELQLSAFSLGKIWFKILKANKDTEVQIKAPNSVENLEAQTVKGVEYRLVPDTRDLLGARMLLTMDPSDGEALKSGGTITPEVAQAAIKKAMTASPKFNSTYNEIPVFMIQQMRMVKQAPEGEKARKEPETLLPMYFNLQNMVSTWQQFTSQSPEAKDVEPAINLMDLFELVEKMQEDCDIDFRNVILIPPTNFASGGGAGSAAEPATVASSSQMPGVGQTLGDL